MSTAEISHHKYLCTSWIVAVSEVNGTTNHAFAAILTVYEHGGQWDHLPLHFTFCEMVDKYMATDLYGDAIAMHSGTVNDLAKSQNMYCI
jgi:hypothetical protein